MRLPRVIPTGIHETIDHAASGVNLTFPGLLTDYELGLVEFIPRPAHPAPDAAKGALLAVAARLRQQGHALPAALTSTEETS